MNPKDFTIKEIYPKVYVYNNVLEDPKRMYEIVKNSLTSKDGIWEDWQDWYGFGDKIENFGISFDKTKAELVVASDVQTQNKTQEDQKYFITEQVKAFLAVTQDYMMRNNLNIIEESKQEVVAKDIRFSDEANNNGKFSKWMWTGPSLCKYYIGSIDHNEEGLAMRYHSDYIREAIKSPGYKFALTCTTYINDEYEGGAVDFAINKKLIRYKPKAGDFLVFPSGHPDYLTEEGKVYLHGVESCQGAEKYFTRMYWQVYEDGSDEWKKNEALYGREEWLKMNAEIHRQYHAENIAKSKIEGATRIS